MNRYEQQIRDALTRIGVQDVIDWAHANCTKSLVDLSKSLSEDIAPIRLELFIANEARLSGRFDDLVRILAVQQLNDPDRSEFCEWRGQVEPAHRKRAAEVWDKIMDTRRSNPFWRPRSPDDPLLVAAFEGVSFKPTNGKMKFEEAMAKAWKIADLDSENWSFARAAKNFQSEPAGYGYLYSLYELDGRVCVDGFHQYYSSTRGAEAQMCSDGFRAIGREEFAAIVDESMLRGALKYPKSRLAKALAAAGRLSEPSAPRSFEELDQAYYALHREERQKELFWLDAETIRLVESHPELF